MQLVGYPNHGGPGNRGLLLEEFLDLARINIESAGDDEITPTPLQRIVTVRRADRLVSGAEIAVAERGPDR